MDPREILEALFRWLHVVVGVLWIGLLYFFNWVNGPFAKTLDAESKPKVVPELLPRALYFFRWGAAYTWLSGLVLLFLVYYANGMALMGDAATTARERGPATLAAFLAMFIGAAVYDQLWKHVKNATAALAISVVLLLAVMAGLHYGVGVPGRALFIHVGALFGTAMAMNVWMRIWPSQRKIISAIKEGNAPDGALVALAGLRSKHNTYMSVPLIFTMISNHYPGIYGFQGGLGWVLLAVFIAVGWIVTYFVYQKSAGPAPTKY